LTEATLVSRRSATSDAFQRRTSRRIRTVRGVAAVGEGPAVGDRLDPRRLGKAGERAVRGADLAEVHRPGAALAAVDHVEGDVRRDPVEPRLEGRAALEAVVSAPGAEHRLLDGVLGLEDGAEHPVAVAGQVPPVGFEAHLEPAGDE
jgi:hypothetical protein